MGTWIVGAFVLAIIGLAGYSVYKDRKTGKSCGCGCENCQSCPGKDNVKTS